MNPPNIVMEKEGRVMKHGQPTSEKARVQFRSCCHATSSEGAKAFGGVAGTFVNIRLADASQLVKPYHHISMVEIDLTVEEAEEFRAWLDLAIQWSKDNPVI